MEHRRRDETAAVPEQLRPQVRLLLVGGALGAVLLVTSLLVELVWFAPPDIPQYPGLPRQSPAAPTIPAVPTIPSIPTIPGIPDIPVIPSGFPTELPSLPAFPGGGS
jgi:hypothetical protein